MKCLYPLVPSELTLLSAIYVDLSPSFFASSLRIHPRWSWTFHEWLEQLYSSGKSVAEQRKLSGLCQSASPLPCWVPNMTVTAVHIIWLFAIVRLWSFGDFVIGEAMWWKCLLAQQVLNWFESKLGLHQGKWLSLNTMIRHYSHRALWKKDGRHWEWTRLKKAVWRTWKKTQGKV